MSARRWTERDLLRALAATTDSSLVDEEQDCDDLVAMGLLRPAVSWPPGRKGEIVLLLTAQARLAIEEVVNES